MNNGAKFSIAHVHFQLLPQHDSHLNNCWHWSNCRIKYYCKHGLDAHGYRLPFNWSHIV